jgi:glycosyltransferase 2 family protein
MTNLQLSKTTVFTVLRFALAIALLAYLGYSGSIDWSSLLGLVREWHYTLVAVLLFIAANVLISWRLQLLINAQRLKLPFFAAVRLIFIGLFFNTYLPGATGGDIVKIYYASKGNPGKRAEVVTILILDRFVGLFCLLTLPLLLAPFFMEMVASRPALQGLLWVALVVACGMIVAVVIGTHPAFRNSRLLHWIYTRMPLGMLLQRALDTLHNYRHNKSVILQAMLLSYLLQLLMIGVSLAIAQATGPQGADPRMIMLIPLGFLANSLPVTPGGIGVGEAALAHLFMLFGMQGGAEVLLGWRLILIVTGLLGLVFYLRGEKRFVFSAGHDATTQ